VGVMINSPSILVLFCSPVPKENTSLATAAVLDKRIFHLEIVYKDALIK